MTDFTPSGAGAILPPGSLPAAEPLAPGTYTVTVEGFDEQGYARVAYPGGFTRHHQAATVEELLPKVVNLLRGRHSCADVEFTSVPAELAEGATIEVGV